MRQLKKILIFQFFILEFAFSQAVQKNEVPFDFMTDVLGKKGVAFFIGLLFFVFTYKNSVKLFNWIEDQTYGNRDYILKQCERLFIVVDPQKLTYGLLIISFGLGIIIIGIFSFLGLYLAGFFVGLLFAFIGWKAPRPIVDHLVDKRIKEYRTQMVDGLNLLSNGLRAGLSVPQSLGMVVDELPAPLSQEFNVILQQTKIGVPLEEAFNNLVKRMPTEDNEMFVSSVNILRETGGNLAEVFDSITDVIRERVRLQQKIDVYTAQGKAQGFTIFCMPFAMGAMFTISDPDSMMIMFTNPVGIIMLVIAVVLDLIGLWLILKITKIEV